MRWITLLLLIASVGFMAGCDACPENDNACYKYKYGLVPDETTASGYRPLTIGEYIFGEKKIEENQKKP